MQPLRAAHRWQGRYYAKLLYGFGYGLSYTSLEYVDLVVHGGETVTASFTVTDTGDRAGADVPRLHLTNAPGEQRMRLLGFERVDAPAAPLRSLR